MLKPGADDAKSKSQTDLESAVAKDVSTLQEAMDGLKIIDEISAGTEARNSYLKAAQKRWPEASVFQQSA